MRWAVVGSKGMLGTDLVGWLLSMGEEVHGFHRGNLELTVNSSDSIHKLKGFDVVVNCVAYTKVDLAESQRSEAFFANALVPAILGAAAKTNGSRFIHISTDYVFDGTTEGPYQTDSPKNPKSAYGETKSIGEDLALEFENAQVVRTSWLYGANGKCFPKTIAGKLFSGEALKVVDDQIGSPTHTLDLAQFLFNLGKSQSTGQVLHGVSSGQTSWFGFAIEIAKSLDQLVDREDTMGNSGSFVNFLAATSTKNFHTPAKRPANGVLEPSRVDNYEIPDWKASWSQAAPNVLSKLS